MISPIGEDLESFPEKFTRLQVCRVPQVSDSFPEIQLILPALPKGGVRAEYARNQI